MNLSQSPFGRLVPAMFVLLWATGFIGAKYGLPYAGPLSFLALRFAIVVVILALIAWAMGAPWPADIKLATRSVISGFLIHGVYLGGVFIAISLGMSAGVSALIVGLQPLLTAVLSGPLLGETIVLRHWLGVAIGLLGLCLVLLPKLQPGAIGAIDAAAPGGVGGLSLGAVAAAVIALIGITLGTIYQKAYAANADLRTGGALQYLGATLPLGVAAWFFEGPQITWSWPFVGALVWLIVVLSLGAITLLMLIIRDGAVSKVSALFYLVPPVTAVIAYLLFGETLTLVQVLGIALAALAVWFVSTATSVKRAAVEEG